MGTTEGIRGGGLVSARFAGADGVLAPGTPEAELVARVLAAAPPGAGEVVAHLRAQGIPPGALAVIGPQLRPELAGDAEWDGAVAADRERLRRLDRADGLASAALEPFAGDVALLAPALSRMWSSDVDVLVRRGAPAAIGAALRASGCIALDDLLDRIGRGDPDVDRFAVVDGTEVLGALELCRRAYDDGPQAEPMIDRAEPAPGAAIGSVVPADLLLRRAGKAVAARRMSVRSVLELRALSSLAGGSGDAPLVRAALARAADVERGLGVAPAAPESGEARPWTDRSWVRARARSVGREARRALRPRGVQVVFSGIDGAGKSTQVERLSDNLLRVNITRTTAWVRLGFTGSPLLSLSARFGQRVLPDTSHSAHVARSTGTGEETPITRRGIVGWSWALAVTGDFIRASRKAVRRAHGSVGIFDRALLDAEIALDHDYGGALDLRFHHRLLRRLMRHPDTTFYLRIAGEIAYDRKEDMFSRDVLVGMVARYDAFMAGRAGVVIVDAQDPPDRIALTVLRRLAGEPE